MVAPLPPASYHWRMRLKGATLAVMQFSCFQIRFMEEVT